jgi:nucleobase:cation symporter-1, NCS1 family
MTFKWGINWRTVLTLVLVVPPTIPGLISSINKKIHVGDINWIFLVSWIWGVVLSMLVYSLLNYFFPATETLVDHPILAEYDQNSKPSSFNLSTDDVSEKEKTAELESQ